MPMTPLCSSASSTALRKGIGAAGRGSMRQQTRLRQQRARESRDANARMKPNSFFWNTGVSNPFRCCYITREGMLLLQRLSAFLAGMKPEASDSEAWYSEAAAR